MYTIKVELSIPTKTIEFHPTWLNWSNTEQQLNFGRPSSGVEDIDDLHTFEKANDKRWVKAFVVARGARFSIEGNLNHVRISEINQRIVLYCNADDRLQFKPDTSSELSIKSQDSATKLLNLYWKSPVGRDHRISTTIDSVDINPHSDGSIEITCELIPTSEIATAISVLDEQIIPDKSCTAELLITTDQFHRVTYFSQSVILSVGTTTQGNSIRMIGSFNMAEWWHTIPDQLTQLDYQPFAIV